MTVGPFNFPIVLSQKGLQPQSPQSLLQQLIAAAVQLSPGLTATLPGSLIEDISSTDVAAMSLIDQAKVELLNSLTPYGANVFLLTQLGQIYGQQLGEVTNTSVYVVFSGSVGYTIANGVLVGDGTNVYQVQGGGAIGGGGTTAPLLAISIAAGSFTVNANTVTQVLTPIPPTYNVTVNNPQAGNPGGPAEQFYQFRARVLQSGLAASVSTSRFIKTLVGNVLGAQANWISVQQVPASGLRVVVGGSSDHYAIANAIFNSIADPSMLQGSAVSGTRDVTVSLIDYPDTYSIKFVAAPVITVTMTVTWNTVLGAGFVGGSVFPGLVQAPIVAYINSLGIGQVINILELNEIFQQAVASVLDPSYLTRLIFVVSLNGTPISPISGTYAIQGDAESYFFAQNSGISVTQG